MGLLEARCLSYVYSAYRVPPACTRRPSRSKFGVLFRLEFVVDKRWAARRHPIY